MSSIVTTYRPLRANSIDTAVGRYVLFLEVIVAYRGVGIDRAYSIAVVYNGGKQKYKKMRARSAIRTRGLSEFEM